MLSAGIIEYEGIMRFKNFTTITYNIDVKKMLNYF